MPRPLSVTVRKPSSSNDDLDMVGVARHRLVHGVVDHLGEEVMHRLLVGAADIHAGAPAHGLEPFQHLDVGGGIVLAVPRDVGRPCALPRPAARRLSRLVFELGEEIARCGGFAHGSFRHPGAPRICRVQGTHVSSHALAAFSRARRPAESQAILPPPFLVMTSTEGRGGMAGSKSGQRVAGSAKVEARSKPL